MLRETRMVVLAVFACSLAGAAPTAISATAACLADDCMSEPKGKPPQAALAMSATASAGIKARKGNRLRI